MLNFYPFTLANSHVMLLLTAAITHGITEDPQEKKLSFFRVCLWLAFVSSWCYQPVSAHDQDKRSQKANQLVSLCSLSNFYNTFFIQYLCRAQFCTNPSLSSVLFVVFRIFSHLPSVLKYTLVFCNQYLSFAFFTCVCLCVNQGEEVCMPYPIIMATPLKFCLLS